MSIKKRQKNRSQSANSESHSGSSKNGDDGSIETTKITYGRFFDDLITPMITPGAGLRPINSYHLSQQVGSRMMNTDHIFDSIFGENTAPQSTPHIPLLRSYSSDKDM